MDAHHTAARVVAWGGAVLFAVSLGYFLFTYIVTFAEIRPGRVDPGALLTDVALFGIFAVHHSVFARHRVRALVAHLVPAHLERSLYVWVASAMLIAVCAGWQPLSGVGWSLGGIWRWVATACQVAGIWLTLRSATLIDAWELAGVRQTSSPNAQVPIPQRARRSSGATPTDRGRPSGRPGLEFKTEGPYGWVRHPIYLGWVFIVFGVWTMTMDRLVFAVVSSVYILIAIPLEERSLRHSSHGAYDEYMRRVRWKLLPHVY